MQSQIEYVKLNKINLNELISLLNNKKNRVHLIQHKLFNTSTARAWISSKIQVDSSYGCKVRAIVYNNKLAGWCGIQFEEKKYEIAIVIDNKFWGLGRRIFGDIMYWAKKLGHKNIFIHLLHTRYDYKFLQKMAKNVYETKFLDNRFTTYHLEVK